MTYKLLSAAGLIVLAALSPGQALQPKDGTASPAACQPAECRAFPKAKTADEAFLHLQVAIGALNERAQVDTAISTASRTAVHAQINELQDMFRTSSGPAAAEPDYVENLDLAATAIMSVVGEEDPTAANRTLDLLQRDLQIKLRSARATMGAEGGKPKTIPVVITTKRGTVPVSGYRIKLADALRGAWPPTLPFDQLSNPGTRRNVTPGVYLVYAYRNEAVAGKEMLDIGLEGQTSVKLDLQVK